ncbi:MAG: MFS transporter [candidate division WOR-3 bacterium]|nr:MFS transporter [candidate division WOR-3 bacterium]
MPRNCWLFLTGTFFMGMGFSGFMLLFNLYLKSINLGEGKIGNIITASTLGTLIMAIPASFIIRQTSIKKLLLISIPFAVICYFIQVSIQSYHIVLWTSLLSGIANVFFQVAAAPFFMRNSTPNERPYLFSLNFAASLIAGTIGSILGGLLPGMIEKYGLAGAMTFRYTLYIFGGLVMAAIIPYLSIDERIEQRIEQPEKKLQLCTKKSINIKLFLPNFVTGLGAGLSIPFMNLYFKTWLDVPTYLIGVYFSLSQFLMIIGLLIAPLIAEKIGKIKTVFYSQIFSIPFLIIMGVTKNINLAVVSFLVRATLMNMAQPLFTNFAMEKVDKDEQPITNALLIIAWTAGRGLSAGIGGLLIEHLSSYALPFFTTSFLYLISSILLFVFFR